MMWYRGPYFILTCTLLAAILAYPLAATLLGELVLRVVTTLMLFSALYAVMEPRWLFRLLGFFLVPILAGNWFVDPIDHPNWSGLVTICVMIFLLITLVAILERIIASKKVTSDVIFGSIAVYLLFGIVIAMSFHFLNMIDPGNVLSTVGAADLARHQGQFSEFLYFSFITLTSVGYGDIAPVDNAARSIAMFEGIVGQLYVAILIARLVSMHIANE